MNPGDLLEDTGNPTFQFEFEHLFRQWSAWFRLRRTAAWLLRGLIFGLAMSLGFSLVSLTQSGLLKNEFLTLIFRFTVLSSCVSAFAGLVWPVSKVFLALFYDQHFLLRERSQTALELLEPQSGIPPQSGELVEKQLKDTLNIGSQVQPKASFFMQITRLQVILISTLTAGLLLLGVFGEPFFQRTLVQRQTRLALAQEAANLEALAEKIRNARTGSPKSQRSANDRTSRGGTFQYRGTAQGAEERTGFAAGRGFTKCWQALAGR
jgi:hypothetical protein